MQVGSSAMGKEKLHFEAVMPTMPSSELLSIILYKRQPIKST